MGFDLNIAIAYEFSATSKPNKERGYCFFNYLINQLNNNDCYVLLGDFAKTLKRKEGEKKKWTAVFKALKFSE